MRREEEGEARGARRGAGASQSGNEGARMEDSVAVATEAGRSGDDSD